MAGNHRLVIGRGNGWNCADKVFDFGDRLLLQRE